MKRLTTVEADETSRMQDEAGKPQDSYWSACGCFIAMDIWNLNKCIFGGFVSWKNLNLMTGIGENPQFMWLKETKDGVITPCISKSQINKDEEAEAYILKDTSDAASEGKLFMSLWGKTIGAFWSDRQRCFLD